MVGSSVLAAPSLRTPPLIGADCHRPDLRDTLVCNLDNWTNLDVCMCSLTGNYLCEP